MMSRFSYSIAGLAVALSFAAAASAASITVTGSVANKSGIREVRAVAVSLDDADLATAAGAQTLFDRIDRAARAVCGETAGKPSDKIAPSAFATCRNRAVHYAVKEIDAPQLTQLAGSR